MDTHESIIAYSTVFVNDICGKITDVTEHENCTNATKESRFLPFTKKSKKIKIFLKNIGYPLEKSAKIL